MVVAGFCLRQNARRFALRRTSAAVSTSSNIFTPRVCAPSISSSPFSQRRNLVTADTPKRMKRFYTKVDFELSSSASSSSSSSESSGSDWKVTLDGKAVKTPKGSLLEIPAEKLAQQVCAEWEAQTEYILPREMRTTTLCCTALDLVGPDKGVAAVERMMPYLETDTLCFEDENKFVLERQRAEWGPLIEWFNQRFGVKLAISTGLAPPQHPEGTIEKVQNDLLKKDPWELCALEVATASAKSLIVACALLERPDMDAEQAFKLAWLEELGQIERWGLVEGEHDISHQDAQAWLSACRGFAPQHRC